MGQSDAPRLYVCENCGRLGVWRDFADDCTPGWTHGRLHRIESVTEAARDSIVGAEPEPTPRGRSAS